MRKVKWLSQAELSFYEQLDFWNNHNKSTEYSKKIITKTQEAQYLIAQFPYTGREIKYENDSIRRILILNRFWLYYRVLDTHIQIIEFISTYQEKREL